MVGPRPSSSLSTGCEAPLKKVINVLYSNLGLAESILVAAMMYNAEDRAFLCQKLSSLWNYWLAKGDHSNEIQWVILERTDLFDSKFSERGGTELFENYTII